MWTVQQLAKMAGVTARAVRHYDAVGLLPPARHSEAGYRLYDQNDWERLQDILLFRELRFSLREIKGILDRPDFQREEALRQQIRLLEMERSRLDRILDHARELLEKKGGDTMECAAFDRSEIDRYAGEVRERWGLSDAYGEFQEKAAPSGETLEGLMQIFVRFGQIRNTEPESPEARRLVGELKDYITKHFYTCTPEILRGLGELYVSDPRFRQNIDRAGGEGTAEFVRRAVMGNAQ